jgi:putative oxidoreductase
MRSLTEKLTGKSVDFGLLLIRLGIGLIFVLVYGLTKLKGGAQLWQGLGGSMNVLGITFAPTFWGLMATLSEFLGGICIVTGILFRPACAFMMFTMAIAVMTGISTGHGLNPHPLELFFVFTGLILSGPGRFTVWYLIQRIRRSNND